MGHTPLSAARPAQGPLPPAQKPENIPAVPAPDLLKFRCTGCGNCCKEPLLPLTDADVKRITDRTGDDAGDVVRFIDRNAIDMDDEPEGFAMLRQGRRVMVLRHQNGACRYLGKDERCTIYTARPFVCRIFPFDPSFDRNGKLKRLKLIQATDCKYELDGDNDPESIRRLHTRYEDATHDYQDRIADWNRLQKARRRAGRGSQTSREFLAFLGLASD